MEKFISFDKLSKKKKKEINNSKRETWGDFCPLTRTVESKKNYSRKIKHKGGANG